MRTAFDPAVRVLACDQCGAPLEGATGAIELTCSYCDARNRLAVPTKLSPAPALSASEQRARLQQQEQRPRAPSPAVADFVDGSRLAPWREQEALAAWVDARARIRGGAADHTTETRFVELTRLLADAAGAAKDALRQRALLESGYEISPLARARTVFAGQLAQRAARAGDLASAKAWIGRCDAGVDDLEAFSTLAIARGLVAHAEDAPAEVIDALGTADAPVPLEPEDRSLAAALRAHALELQGDVAGATDTLEQAAAARWPTSRAEIVLAREALQGDVAPRATAAFEQRRGAKFLAKRRYNLVVLAGFSLLWGGLAAGAIIHGLKAGAPGFAVASVVPGGISVFMIVALVRLLGDRDAWRQRIWATVHDVQPPTGESSGRATLVLDERPDKPLTLGFSKADVVTPGARVLLRRTWLAGERFLE